MKDNMNKPNKPKNGICGNCGDKSRDGLYKCPECGTLVCADQCCAGAGTWCFIVKSKTKKMKIMSNPSLIALYALMGLYS